MSANTRAALLMIAAMTAFTLNDAITKWVSTEIGVGQTMVLRGILATLILGLLAFRQGAFARPEALKSPVVLGRSGMEIGGTITFLLALPHLPISNVSAIYQALPLVVTLGAALFLKEPVGWRRWSAILVGFCGVMLIIRPGAAAFNGWSLLVILSLCFSTARDLLTRKVPPGTSTFGVAMLASIGVTLAGAAMIPLEGGFKPVTLAQAVGIAASAGLISAAYITLIGAMRGGDISFVAPFRYVALIVAILVGYLAFNERPDVWMLTGSAIVIASGIYMFHRERVRANLALARTG
ncbi:MAG: DMT family transporter [Rhizobiaceae bacterium]|jgi:drug/metabolite transporter (DMT)-like permease|nr:DMT family transporter [Rhizobiaceae bacterium]